MLDDKELLFNKLYEDTKDCGRVQFVKLLMETERENQELKKKLQTKHDGFMASTDELCEYATENEKLKMQQKEFIKYLEDKKDRLIKETSH